MVLLHNIIACHIQADLQSGFFCQFNGTKYHIMILHQITFNEQISIALKHLP